MQQQLDKTITGDDTITEPALEEISELQNRAQIAALAHALWQTRGCPDGTPDEDWFRAEREINGSRRMDEERSIDTETADSPMLRFPVGSELAQAAHAGSSRRG
jgi:Protein of unknown function (DUF2934)